VSVFATIEDGPDPGFAYLTNQIGPGTTAANEIASGAFSFPAASTETLLFSGLTLPAGTYYLTLTVTNSGSGGWFGTNTPTATTAAGVTLFPDYDTFTPAAYPPATSFFTPTSTNLIFRVTAIPESSALIQFLLGGGLIAFLGLRRSVVRAAEE
jgi:hypothetical protein